VIVPEIVRLTNPADPLIATVFVVPESATVEPDPFVNVPPLLFQFPETFADPIVKEKVVPAPTVTSPKVTVDDEAVSPPVPTRERAAPPVMAKPEVVSVPVPDVDNVPETSIAVF